MAAHNSKHYEINLLPQEEFASSTIGRVLHWLLSTFRYLVITTEMVVITAFISRFYFDSRIADLNEKIEQKSAFIAGNLNFEKRFRYAQKRLGIFDQLSQDNKKASPILEQVSLNLPMDIALTDIHLSDHTNFQIDAGSLSEQSISQFIVNLEHDVNFENISLSQIDSKATTPLVSFTLEGGIATK